MLENVEGRSQLSLSAPTPMAIDSDFKDDLVILLCTNPDPSEAGTKVAEEIPISANDIVSCDMKSIRSRQRVKFQGNRGRLVDESSYFRSLLSGSFSESCMGCISIEWDLETFMNVIKCIYCCSLDITSDNFISLLEGALYFGVESLLLKCKSWFSEICLSGEADMMKIKLSDLIRVWNFGLEHAIDYVSELCVSYVAKNFMCAISNEAFVDMPYELLLSCVKHHHLTVDSEMHLSDALLFWLNAKTEWSECSTETRGDYADVLNEIRIGLLPLWFSAGKLRSKPFSKLARESIDLITRLIHNRFSYIFDFLEEANLIHTRIRLTEYSKKVNLSGCPQLTSLVLVLSVLPSLFTADSMLKKIFIDMLQMIEQLDEDKFPDLSGRLPIISNVTVQELDISKCPRIHLGAALECFCKSFPSLRTLRATCLSDFKIKTLWKLVRKCPMICEVDLTVDISPLVPSQVTVISSSQVMTPLKAKKLISVKDNPDSTSLFISEPSFSNITKLMLEGRTDILDSDLQLISALCKSLSYLNIKGCFSVTDGGIANLIQRCINLQSIDFSDTSFGTNSIRALCSCAPDSTNTFIVNSGDKHIRSLANKLQMLHIGGCKGVDEKSLAQLLSQAQMLKSLCLRDTMLKDHALCGFLGSLLEMLDVSNTMISGGTLAHVVHWNPGLRCLKARGCKQLFDKESNLGGRVSLPPSLCKELYLELGKTSRMEELELGWGFSPLSLEALKPAIKSLKEITLSLGASVGEDELILLPKICPALESVTLYFQVISDAIIISITTASGNMQGLALCYCFGDISISSFKFIMPNLEKLKLERVAHWMRNDDLLVLTENCPNLTELSLTGCKHLNPDTQKIISNGWPGLLSIHIEDSGNLTANGVSSLLDCKALEDLLLRHNGRGISRNFILEAALKLPMLRHVSLDLCDASDADFDIPDHNNRNFLSTVKIARCKCDRNILDLHVPGAYKRVFHKESLVLVWDNKKLTRAMVKERL